MSLGEAKDFIAEKVEAVKAESQPPAAGDDAEDLVSCAINYRYEVDKSFLFFFILGKSLSIHKSSWNEFSFKAPHEAIIFCCKICVHKITCEERRLPFSRSSLLVVSSLPFF